MTIHFYAGFHEGFRSSCRLVHLQPYLIMMRCVMVLLASCFVLTLLEPPSPESSHGPREVERSLQIIPQLPGALPMNSPPESYPDHREAGESSRATPVSKRWFRTRFKKTNKSQASQPPDQLSTKSSHPIDPGFDSQSQPTASIAKKGPSTMAAGKRVRVSVFCFGRQKMCGVPDEVSQRAVAVDLVRYSVCSLVHCLSCVTE